MNAEKLESRTSEIPRLYYVYLTLAAVYLTISIDLIDTRLHQTSKPAVEAILQLLELASEDIETEQPLTLYDARRFFASVQREVSNIRTQILRETDRRLFTVQDLYDRGFDDLPVARSFVHQLQAHSRPIRYCEVALTQLESGVEAPLLIFGLDGRLEFVDSSSISLVAFDQCKIQGWRELNALIFRTDGGAVFGLPEAFLKSFPGLKPEPFKPEPFDFNDEIKGKVTERLRPYISSTENYYTFSESMLSYRILQMASSITGESFALTDIDEAAKAIFRVESRQATFLGVTSSAFLIVSLSPIVFLFLSWNIWLRIRGCDSHLSLKKQSNWFVFDSDTFMDRSLSTLAVLTYLGFAIVIPYLFILSRGAGLSIAGNFISLTPWLNLTLEATPPRGYLNSEWGIGIIAGLIFTLNIIYVSKTSILFLKIIWGNFTTKEIESVT